MVPMAERKKRDEGDEMPKTSKQLKTIARKKKNVEFAARMSSELHS